MVDYRVPTNTRLHTKMVKYYLLVVERKEYMSLLLFILGAFLIVPLILLVFFGVVLLVFFMVIEPKKGIPLVIVVGIVGIIMISLRYKLF